MTTIDTTRRYARTLREAFPMDDNASALGIAGPVVIRLRTPWPVRVLRFTLAYLRGRK